MLRKVSVIDYGIGNVYSVCNALEQIGAQPFLSSDPSAIEKSERVILPGVGAFSKAMQNLRKEGLDEAVMRFVETGKPFLGICIGMQVLMERSLEFGLNRGLGLIKGGVERIDGNLIKGIKVPHIGWSNVRIDKKHSSNKLEKIFSPNSFFYFTHSYYCKPDNHNHILGTISLGDNIFTAILRNENMVGVQFHPERSGQIGLNFLSAFVLDEL